ncbi:MAG: signal peptide peptidase SppA [Victivallaceae bacterium]
MENNELKSNSTENIENNRPVAKQNAAKTGCMWMLMSLGMIFLLLLVCGIIVCSVAFFSFFKNMEDESADNYLASYEKEFISGKRSSENTILVIPVSGVIHSGLEDSPFSEAGAASNKICRQLEAAARDKSVKAVIIKVDSPGGEVVATDMIYRAIKKLKANGTPVIALMESIAASGGYYISVGCDKIIAHPMTTTGSIGVIVQTYKYFELFKKVGLESEPYTSGPLKDILSGTRPTTPIEKQIIQKHVDAVYDQFVQIIADGRPGLTVQKIKTSEIGDGRIFIGAEAKRLGLVDQLGYFADAEKLAAEMAKLKDDYATISYKKKFSLTELFNSSTQTPAKNLNLNLPGASAQTQYNLKNGRFYLLPAWH